MPRYAREQSVQARPPPPGACGTGPRRPDAGAAVRLAIESIDLLGPEVTCRFVETLAERYHRRGRTEEQ